MLVLSRKMNEQIIIGDNVKITICRIKGNAISIGIEAPREVPVVRGELLAKRRAALETDIVDASESAARQDASRPFANSQTTSLTEVNSAKRAARAKRKASGHAPVNRLDADREPVVFVGKVGVDGSNAGLRPLVAERNPNCPAPLAHFVAAS